MYRILFTIFCTILFVACGRTDHEEGPEPPLKNILVIVGDDHATGVLGAYGNTVIRTPNLDKLADTGVQFNHAFANSPLCSASRQSLLTGRYPHATGVTLLTTSFPEEQVTLPEHLAPHGFTSALIGKSHFNNQGKHGFDTLIGRNDWQKYIDSTGTREVPDTVRVRPPWKPFRDHARIWLNADAVPGPYYEQDDIATFYTNQAIEFLERNKYNRFCLWLAYHEPHSPFNFPIEFSGKYDPAAMPLPTGSGEDDRWIPEVFKDLTEEERRGIISAYYTSVEYLDTKIGQILTKLEEIGEDKNTVVVYLGDHGYLLNDHKRFEKHMMWEEAVRTPLLIRPGYGEEKKIDQMVEFVDVLPTILDYLGIPEKEDAQGRTLRPLISGEDTLHKDYIFSEFLADNKAMVRSERWKYVYTTGKNDLGQGYATGNPPPGVTHRLYDLQNDGRETRDVFHEKENAEVVAQLQGAMINWFMKTHPRAREIRENMTLEEKLAFFCEPPDVNPRTDAK